MSAYLTNLLSRSVGKPVVQPRLSPLLGPATAGPEWTLGHGQENGDAEVRVQEASVATPEIPALADAGEGREPRGVRPRTSLAPVSPAETDSQSEPRVAQAAAQDVSLSSNVHPATRLTTTLRRRLETSESAPDTQPHAAAEPPTIDPPVRRESAEEPGVAAPPKPATPRLPEKSVTRAAEVEIPGPDNFHRFRAPAIRARAFTQGSEQTADHAEQPAAPVQDRTIVRPRQQPAASDRLGETARNQIQTLMPDFGKPVERRRVDAGVPSTAPQVRLGRPEPNSTLPAPVSPEPTIAVTIGRIEVRAVSSPQPAKSTPPVAPVMSLDEYLRRRSGRS